MKDENFIFGESNGTYYVIELDANKIPIFVGEWWHECDYKQAVKSIIGGEVPSQEGWEEADLEEELDEWWESVQNDIKILDWYKILMKAHEVETRFRNDGSECIELIVDDEIVWLADEEEWLALVTNKGDDDDWDEDAEFDENPIWEKLTELGYDHEDVSEISHDPFYDGGKRLRYYA